MIQRIFMLSWTGFIQLLRSRIYINLLAANVFMVITAFILDRLSAGEGARMLINLGMSLGSLVTAVMAGTVAIVTLTTEIENKQIHLLLARPITRFEIIIGKFFTIAFLVTISNFIIGLVLWGMAIGIQSPHPERLFIAINYLSIEGYIVVAIAILFGIGSSSMMAATFTTLFFILGRLSDVLKQLVDGGKFADLSDLLNVAYYLVPHLYLFDLTDWAQGGPAPESTYIIQSVLAGLSYVAILLFLASLRLEKRDIP
jgi:Cu-processing system permease protein